MRATGDAASEAKLAWLDTVWLWVVLWECPNNNGVYKMVSVCVSVDTIILKVVDEFRLYIRGQQTVTAVANNKESLLTITKSNFLSR